MHNKSFSTWPVCISLYFVSAWIAAIWQSVQNFQTRLFCIQFFRDLWSRKSDSRGLKPRGFSAFHVASPGFVRGGGEHGAASSASWGCWWQRQLKAKFCFLCIRLRCGSWLGPQIDADIRIWHIQEGLCQPRARWLSFTTWSQLLPATTPAANLTFQVSTTSKRDCQKRGELPFLTVCLIALFSKPAPS